MTDDARRRWTRYAADSAWELAPGVTSGGIGILLGHPTDTIKTAMQGRSGSTLGTVRTMVANDGVRGLYRGALPPLLVQGTKRGVQMAVWERLAPYLGGSKFLAGGFAGVLGTVVSCPMHVVKVRTQTAQEFMTSAQCAKQVWRAEGVRGFYAGFGAHCLRDTLFASCYLGLYGTARERTSTVTAAVFASLVTWTVLLPFDTWKTMRQMRNSKAHVATTLRLDWWPLFARAFKGLPAALCRAGPVNAVSMLAYEYARDVSKQRRQLLAAAV